MTNTPTPMDKQTAEEYWTDHFNPDFYEVVVTTSMEIDEYSRLRSEEVAVKWERFSEWIGINDNWLYNEHTKTWVKDGAFKNAPEFTTTDLFNSPEFQQYLKDNP